MNNNKPKIVGVDNAKGGFEVLFKNGLDGELDMTMTGLHINAAGGSPVYAAIEACANYLLDSVDKMKAQPQACFDMNELPTKDGKLNFSVKDGELLAKLNQEGEE